MGEIKILWLIYVPTHFNNHTKIEMEYHKIWDRFVEKLTGGLSIDSPILGIWRDKDGVIYEEKMIPIQISCTEEQIEQIVDFTATHYQQKAITKYKISDDFKIYLYNSDFKRIN